MHNRLALNHLIDVFQREIKENLKKRLQLTYITVDNFIFTDKTQKKVYNEAYNKFSKLYKKAIKEKNQFATIITINMPTHIFSVIITQDKGVIVQNYGDLKDLTHPHDNFVDKITKLTKENGKECENVSFWSRDGKHIASCFPQTEQFIIEILRRAENYEGELTMEFFKGVIESLLDKKYKFTFKFNKPENKLRKVLAEIPEEITDKTPKQDLKTLKTQANDMSTHT